MVDNDYLNAADNYSPKHALDFVSTIFLVDFVALTTKVVPTAVCQTVQLGANVILVDLIIRWPKKNCLSMVYYIPWEMVTLGCLVSIACLIVLSS